ncbi:hypothetical protein O181_125487 [Austropuccinia psidii MF-1]|uniref:Uncharacterized protein n=1 Tax=Austropuccinia psidii MF-1 TaxID=1389203 RepID=A0A9Q3Q7I3_9BASI|nr:hypothetical protein [Austropuccinia psidii MF-1]
MQKETEIQTPGIPLDPRQPLLQYSTYYLLHMVVIHWFSSTEKIWLQKLSDTQSSRVANLDDIVFTFGTCTTMEFTNTSQGGKGKMPRELPP